MHAHRYEGVYEGGACEFVLAGLAPASRYYIRVRAGTHKAWSAWCAAAAVDTLPEQGHTWDARASNRCVLVSEHLYIYVYICLSIYLAIDMYMYIYAYMQICIDIYIYLCIYTYIHIGRCWCRRTG